ncbi:MAG: hypothetical protein KAW17_09775 [Candidatus Eisenbacteria sp.]|nr:hypothetical protein [Candidatus Eisenbacteria bacterium]
MFLKKSLTQLIGSCPTLTAHLARKLWEFQKNGMHIADPIVVDTILARSAIDNLPYDVELVGYALRVTKAPTGAAIQCTLTLDGVAVTTVVPSIAIAATTGVWRDDDADPNALSPVLISAGSRLDFDLTQIGSTEPGENLQWALTFRRK